MHASIPAGAVTPVLHHEGDHWSASVHSLYLRCPVGYNVRIAQDSAYGVNSVGLRRSFHFDSVRFTC